jgi:hypothetical protein
LIVAVALAICQPGYATAHRPAWSYTAKIKRHLLHGRSSKRYTLDHILPIELGGDPLDPANMQLQTKAAAHRKDLVENRLHRAVCSGKIDLPTAQAQMKAWK